MRTIPGGMRDFVKIAGTAAVVLSLGIAGNAKKKEKILLPDLVIEAETVAVVILPDTPEPLSDPTANRKAQEEVEKALMKWGRFRLAQQAFTADLVIGIRKGTGKAAQPTISGGPVDTRPVTIEDTGSGSVRVGVQQGRPPDGSQPVGSRGRTNVGMESGTITEDTFEVFQGGQTYGAGNAPLWGYRAKDGLKPPVRAVEEFRKAVEEAQKAAQKRQTKPQAQKKNP